MVKEILSPPPFRSPLFTEPHEYNVVIELLYLSILCTCLSAVPPRAPFVNVKPHEPVTELQYLCLLQMYLLCDVYCIMYCA